jgi:amidohydrolase
MRDISPLIDSALPDLTALRRDLHAFPETGFNETRTAARIAECLASLPGMTVRTGVAGTGVIATLGADRPGPCVALRADMDALPVTEATGRSYASRNPGCSHACGHDGHVACLVGAARVLAALADELAGPVRFVFQPAEEGGAGGLRMCEQGALKDPPVAAIFAMHVWPMLPLGTVGVRPGPILASTDAFDVEIVGRGAHAATPHLGVDPIVIAAQAVTALQSVVARQLNPMEPAVITVGRIAGGTARNVIPERVEVQGTIRALSPALRKAATTAVRRVFEGTALAAGGRAEVRIEPGYPVTVNAPEAAAFVVAAARQALGAAAVHEDLPASMGGEDFAYYLERVPGALWRMGVAAAGETSPTPLHSPYFDFPDEVIPAAVRVHVEIARRFAGHG